MDFDEREKFRELLFSFNGENVNNEASALNKFITPYYPRYLYKYRYINEKSINALKNNLLYFSCASYYDDPFDSFININIEKINLCKEKILAHTQSNIEDLVSNNILPKNDIFEIIQKINIEENNFYEYIISMRELLQKQSYSICLSEEYLNESLWLKYADNHKGFCLGYDLMDDNYLCNKYECCKYCSSSEYNFKLLPVYYNKNKFDATEYAARMKMAELISKSKINDENLIKKIMNLFPLCYWDYEKCCLSKNQIHQFDKEWRLLRNTNQKCKCLCWRPSFIIIGLRTNKEDEKQIIEACSEANIQEIYKCYIDKNNNLSAKKI